LDIDAALPFSLTSFLSPPTDAHIKGISLKKAALFICRFQSLERAMSKIRQAHTVPKEYVSADR
jgi:hypothetical protein